MNDVTIFKLVSAVFIWIVGFAGGILPYFIHRTNVRLMGYLSCFSGGVFLAGGFMHLFHGALENEGLKKWSEMEEGKYEFPWAEMFCTLGFLAVFYVEQAAHSHTPTKNSPQVVTTNRTNAHQRANQLEADQMPFLDVERGMDSGRDSDDEHDHNHDHIAFSSAGTNTAVAFVIFIALSFHSIMEGLGIGAQTESAWGVFLAVIVHKGLAAFALGAGIIKSKVSKKRFVLYMFLFSMMSIIGIIIGWIISSDTSEDSAAAGICLALASGTFIYVAVMEVIPHEFKNKNDTFIKSTFLFLGYAIFGAIAKWT